MCQILFFELVSKKKKARRWQQRLFYKEKGETTQTRSDSSNHDESMLRDTAEIYIYIYIMYYEL